MRKSLLLVLITLIFAAACRKSGVDHTPAIAEAYAGPVTIGLRKDIPLQSPVVAIAKHGDKLQILQQRRRFMKVRTQKGVVGWIEDYLLLTSGEMATLRQMEERARELPSQGAARSYGPLNVHTEPNTRSPSFLQVQDGEKVDVLTHVAAPRVAPKRPPLIPPRPKIRAADRKHAEAKYPLPPVPAGPPPPHNWLELSRTPAEITRQIAEAKAAHAPPVDDWTLIRDSKGNAGWVLTRRVFMAIPDEVAQYAEGHRITSYFPLDEIRDGDQVKHAWLWTTVSGSGHPYDFDSFRVFIWSTRRHRYETSFIQRNVEGYAPVQLRKVQMSNSSARGDAAPPTYPGFGVCLDQGGSRVQRNYAFIVNVVRFAGEQACAPAKNNLSTLLPPH